MRTFSFRIHTLLLVVLMMSAAGVSQVKAQADSTNTEEKKKARLSLDYYCNNNTEQQLQASVKTRVEGKFENVPGLTVHFYRDLVAPENLLGQAVTGHDGRATFLVPKSTDMALTQTFIATIEKDTAFEDAEKETIISKASIKLSTTEEDSVKTVRVMVGTPGADGALQPVADVPVFLFVKRLFGELPLTKEAETTDEEGLVQVEVPPGIPGDKNGEYTLICRISDHELYGNLSDSKTVAWGIPLSLNASAQLQELWLSSANTSEAILVITLVLLFCIFGVVIYIFRQLLNISRLGES